MSLECRADATLHEQRLDNKRGGAAVQPEVRGEEVEVEEGQREAESEEMRWGGFKEALQRQQEVGGVGRGGLVSPFDTWPPCHPTVHYLSSAA